MLPTAEEERLGEQGLPEDITVADAGREEWDALLPRFDDAWIYQTASYGKVRWGERRLARLVVRRRGEIVAAAQVRLAGLPGARVAYVSWGPMWRPRGAASDPERLALAFRALRNEFVVRRGAWLRIVPADEDAGNDDLRARLVAEGFSHAPTPYETLTMDLTRTAEELRKSMRKQWRQALQKAEKADLDVVEGTSPALFQECLRVYAQMHGRKGFARFADMEEFGRMQDDLPPPLLQRMLVCRVEGVAVSALAWSEIGACAIPTLAATGDQALRLNSLNLLYWRMVEGLRARGVSSLNLGGIDREENPGGFIWKSGLSGTLGREVGQIGRFDACERATTRWLVTIADRHRERSRLRRLAAARSEAQRDAPDPSTGDAREPGSS